MARTKRNKASNPAWRPNFHIKDDLPDTKVIRTGFLLNSIFIVFTLLIYGFLAYKEYSISGTRTQIKIYSADIDSNSAENRAIISQFSSYNRSRNKLQEVIKFDKHILAPGEILRTLEEVIPDSMLLSSVSLQPNIIGKGRKKEFNYSLSIQGILEEDELISPSDVINQFRADLAESASIENNLVSDTLNEFTRDNDLRVYNFAIRVILKEGGNQ